MKAYIFSIILVLVSLGVLGQTEPSLDLKVGTLLKIGLPVAKSYKHIKVPKLNFITKRGGVASSSSLVGKEVVIANITEGNDGITTITIKRNDKGRFFGSHITLEASLNEALRTKELLIKK